MGMIGKDLFCSHNKNYTKRKTNAGRSKLEFTYRRDGANTEWLGEYKVLDDDGKVRLSDSNKRL